jgi:hypothetical protein
MVHAHAAYDAVRHCVCASVHSFFLMLSFHQQNASVHAPRTSRCPHGVQAPRTSRCPPGVHAPRTRRSLTGVVKMIAIRGRNPALPRSTHRAGYRCVDFEQPQHEKATFRARMGERRTQAEGTRIGSAPGAPTPMLPTTMLPTTKTTTTGGVAGAVPLSRVAGRTGAPIPHPSTEVSTITVYDVVRMSGGGRATRGARCVLRCETKELVRCSPYEWWWAGHEGCEVRVPRVKTNYT